MKARASVPILMIDEVTEGIRWARSSTPWWRRSRLLQGVYGDELLAACCAAYRAAHPNDRWAVVDALLDAAAARCAP